MGLRQKISSLGLGGCVKTAYNSYKYTDSASNLALHSNVITDISSETTFDINNRLSIGVSNMGASHPKVAESVFTTTDDSTVAHNGTESATIGPGSVLHIEGKFTMGDSYINSHVRIICGEEITIGDDTAIAWGVQLLDDDRHTLSGKPRRAPIRIGDDVWIGHSVSIGKGVSIGDGAVVAKDSVVTSDVPAYTLVAGCPARVIEEDVTWS